MTYDEIEDIRYRCQLAIECLAPADRQDPDQLDCVQAPVSARTVVELCEELLEERS